MFRVGKGAKGYLSVLLLALVFYVVAAGINAAVSAGGERFLQGQVLAKSCLTKGYCYLDDYGRDDVMLLTSDRMLYRLEANRVPEWKLAQTFGQSVFVKGVVRGGVILVNDLAGGGRAKLSKACL